MGLRTDGRGRAAGFGLEGCWSGTVMWGGPGVPHPASVQNGGPLGGQWVPSSGGLGPACLLKAPSRETRESGLRPGCPGQLVLVSSKLCLSKALGLSLSSL